MLNQVLLDVTVKQREEYTALYGTLEWLWLSYIPKADNILEPSETICRKNFAYLKFKGRLATDHETFRIPIIK